MPKQKDLKRLIRSRMTKTGEAYTAARLQILKKTEPTSNYAKVAGMSDASVSKRTGRTWAQWVRTLDAAGASEKPHREIAQHVSSLGTPDLELLATDATVGQDVRDDERVTRDLATSADDGAALDLDERADARSVADRASVQVDECLHDDVFAEGDVVEQAARSLVGRLLSHERSTPKPPRRRPRAALR